MPTRTTNIQFPAIGIARRVGYRASANGQGPFPTPWAVNVRLQDSISDRLRGGSFVAQDPVFKENPVYRDRAITLEDNRIIAARLGDETDTDFSADVSDSNRPIMFQLSEAAEIGGHVVAVIPHKDAYLLCFTATETWVLSGDPATGSLNRVSDEVGIVGSDAWCVNHDTIYFLSSDGLYSVGANGSGLAPVSDDRLPEELSDVTDSATVLDYYHPDEGVYIHIPSAPVSWFYDTARQGFWAFTLDSTDSHLLIGPFRLGRDDAFGRILTLQGNMSTGSDDVIWRVVTGDSAEDAATNGKLAIEAELNGDPFDNYYSASGTWSAGRSHRSYPRTRAVWCVLWLHSEGTWAFEEVILHAMLSGKWR